MRAIELAENTERLDLLDCEGSKPHLAEIRKAQEEAERGTLYSPSEQHGGRPRCGQGVCPSATPGSQRWIRSGE
jgi:hypothetical protein